MRYSSKQLKIGIKVEHEHKPTIRFIKRYVNRTGHLPSNNKIYSHIAQNHLSENKNYYTNLKKLKL